MFDYGAFDELTFDHPRFISAGPGPEPGVQIPADSRFVPSYEYIPRKRKKRKEAHEEREEIAVALKVAMDGPMADPKYRAKVLAQDEEDLALLLPLL